MALWNSETGSGLLGPWLVYKKVLKWLRAL